MTPDTDSYLRHFGAIDKYENGEQDYWWNAYYLYLFTLMQILHSFVEPRTLNGVR